MKDFVVLACVPKAGHSALRIELGVPPPHVRLALLLANSQNAPSIVKHDSVVGLVDWTTGANLISDLAIDHLEPKDEAAVACTEHSTVQAAYI